MLKRRIHLIVVAIVFLITFSITGLSIAQTDDEAPVPPTEPPPIDWANVELPPHDFADVDFAQAQQFLDQGGETAVSSPSIQPPAAVLNSAAYTVQSGDTLFRIGLKFNVSVSDLVTFNQLSNKNLIVVGQVLQIPAGSVSPPPADDPPRTGSNTYTVQAGDTLYRIARRLGIPVNDIINANNITNPSLIYPGTVLTIPTGSGSTPPNNPPPTAPPAPPPPPEVPPVTEENVYIVQPGDTLLGIARKFGISVSALTAANGITTFAFIHPGQQLIIPSNEWVPPAPTPVDSQFIWPVENGYIVQRYRSGHKAIDIVVPIGTPVKASAAGTVEFAGWNNHGYGYMVVIDHGNGMRTLYAHHDSLSVATGDPVSQGTQIGLSGSTGRSSMPHLHLEMMFDTYRAVNPCDHLPGGC